MKKTLFAISAIAMLLGFTACTDENENINPQNDSKVIITLNASTEEATRTALNGSDEDGYTVVWSGGDVITVGTCNFTLSSGEGTTSGEFTYIGTAPADGTYDAWYGVSSANFLSAQQIYKAGKITNSPMHTEVTINGGTAEGHATFKNLCGLLRLSVKGTATIKTITISAEQAMAGRFTINSDGGAKITDTRNSITLDCGAGVALNESTATDFFIAMPANTYTGVIIKLTNTYGTVCTKRFTGAKGLTIERSKISKASFTASKFDSQSSTTTINGHEYVELAGYYWATENAGEVPGVTHKYSGNDKNTNPYGCCYYEQGDAIKAAESWGGTWTLPTAEQWQALLNGCTWTWKTDYGFGGKTMAGYLVSDNTDASKFIFLPAAGYYWSNIYYVQYQGNRLLYWSSTVNNNNQEQKRGAYLYYSGNGTPYVYSNQNELTGFSVRPVAATLPAPATQPEGALPRKFNVSDTKQVYLSKGNLYYDGSTFQFESNQYSIATSWDASHVSNFFWSQNAAEAYASGCSTETAAAGDVLFTNATETTPNTSFTVNGQTGVWRTLSSSEWKYLFGHSNCKYTTVVDMPGMVIAPVGVSVEQIPDSYNVTTWAIAESNGFVFLPNTGYRSGTTISETNNDTNKSCIYWSSTLSTDNKPYRMFFQWNGEKLLNDFMNDSPCYWGIGIRLVTDVK